MKSDIRELSSAYSLLVSPETSTVAYLSVKSILCCCLYANMIMLSPK